jgi:hypothetical protein
MELHVLPFTLRKWSAVLRVIVATGLLLVGSLAAVEGLDAQRADPASRECTYESCAVRLEGGRLVRISDGRTLTNFSLIAPRLANVVKESERAASEARAFQRAHDLEHLSLSAGALSLAFLPLSEFDLANPAVLSFSAVGVVLLVYGLRQRQVAREALERTIRWYNEDLPR